MTSELSTPFQHLRYELFCKDDLSGYGWLRASPDATSLAAASHIAAWTRMFSPLAIWVSDQGARFKNTLIQALADIYRVKNHTTIAYAPSANGTVETVMRPILSTTAMLLDELNLGLRIGRQCCRWLSPP